MSIERDGKQRQIACDHCGNSLDLFDEAEFEEMIADAKEKGWRIRNEDPGWTHMCPAHQETPLERARRLLG